ncbi:uncharacterized protein LOC109719417 isoform X2 [Ananas comosus]|uniref:Uncharacterized protein LOC109719417 isoform X2 n=1 Tax=Ananas comosus TaxID=4615 RepID=A0A6P5G8U8_ANACO|nr:uncharacterized protein LOC109719417 isoform X2 [Ananas comosus]
MDEYKRSMDLASGRVSGSDHSNFLFDEDKLQETHDEEGSDWINNKMRDLAKAIRDDNPALLVSLFKSVQVEAPIGADPKDKETGDLKSLDPGTLVRLLHLACKMDSAECAKVLIEGGIGVAASVNERDRSGRTLLHVAAEMHSSKCINLLLQKNARTDLRSNDGRSLLALEIALSSARMQVDWSPNQPIEELLTILRELDMNAIRLLAEKTRDVAEVAYTNAMEGRVVALAALLLVTKEKVTAPVAITSRREGMKKNRTLYGSLFDEALALGEGAIQVRLRQCSGDGSSDSSERRKALLREIELLQLFGAVSYSDSKDKKSMPPLLRASQAHDEPVIKLLLKGGANTNESDSDGNSSLHWCLTGSSSSQDLRIMLLLLKNGAAVSHKNRLGLTPVHVAAAKGKSQALQLLLLHAPECVDIVSERKETPLFFAVKSDSLACAQFLLHSGANSQVLNLRRQRPIDMAKSQDMRFILNPANQGFCSRFSPSKEDLLLSLPKDEFTEDMYEELLELGETGVSRSNLQLKTPVCRYYESQSGCVRGAKCFYAHGEGDKKRSKVCSVELKQTPKCVTKYPLKLKGDLNRKVFVGGLPPTVDSDHLKEFFEAEFGPVKEAVVIGTQAGNYMQSRGFGFVTFEHEDMVATAIQAHFVNIFGKKVEIKSAVAKPAEALKTAALQQQLILKEPNLHNDPLNESPETLDEQSLPDWFFKFRKWLPAFLKAATQRLGGEWYPLSSLKGDFRATCGMELDHVSLGFLKLSDFMRALPGICRMRIVPVGAGPATHMVLSPLLFPHKHVKLLPPSSQQQEQLQQPPDLDADLHLSELIESQLVDSYAGKNSLTDGGSSKVLDFDLLGLGYTNQTNTCYGDQPEERGNISAGSSFSLFQTQWDRYLQGMCIICHFREASLQLIPCSHKVCGVCMVRRTFTSCMICGSAVYGVKPSPPSSEPECSEMGTSGEQSLCIQRSLSPFPSIEVGKGPVEPKCRLRVACQGARATVSCLPCAHSIACRQCILSFARMPQICVVCGFEAELFQFSDA